MIILFLIIIIIYIIHPAGKLEPNLFWRTLDCKDKFTTRSQRYSQLQPQVRGEGGVRLAQQNILLQRLDHGTHEKPKVLSKWLESERLRFNQQNMCSCLLQLSFKLIYQSINSISMFKCKYSYAEKIVKFVLVDEICYAS